jgi:hypothetical protein
MRSIEEAVQRLSGRDTDKRALYAAQRNSQSILLEYKFRKALRTLKQNLSSNDIDIGAIMADAYVAAAHFHYRTTPGMSRFFANVCKERGIEHAIHRRCNQTPLRQEH